MPDAFENRVWFERPVTDKKSDDKVDVRWIATLSNGETAVEHSGEWILKSGERKPWIRLIQYAAKNGLYLTSLRLNIKGRTIHMPRDNFIRFSMEGRTPLYYSVEYKLEGEMSGGGLEKITHFIDLTSHYENFEVHYIQDITDGANSWVVVTENHMTMAPSPRNRDTNDS